MTTSEPNWIRPVSLQIVQPRWAVEVSSPPHDAMSAQDRQDHLRRNPRSFLSVTRGPDDVVDGRDLNPRQLLALGRQSLMAMLDEGLFTDRLEPALYLYRLETADHRQTGIVCAVATDAYDQGKVRIHEQVRPERASHLADHLDLVGVQSSPIAMAFRDESGLAEHMDGIVDRSEPVLSFRSEDGLGQQVIPVEAADADLLVASLDRNPLYLIDGHHRAAASSVHQARRAAAGLEARGWMLSVLFPADQLRNLAFHRVVRNVEPTMMETLDRQLAQRFSVRHTADPVEASRRRPSEIAMARPNPDQPDGPPRWTLIELPVGDTDGGGRLADLEQVRLSELILGPVFDIDEAEVGDRLTYRSGTDDVAALSAIRPEPNQVTFVLRPVPMSTLLAVADRGHVMPPKSTYFEPKVRSGIFLRHVTS
jgi:uncharacterized protein (DUF1015 family)